MHIELQNVLDRPTCYIIGENTPLSLADLTLFIDAAEKKFETKCAFMMCSKHFEYLFRRMLLTIDIYPNSNPDKMFKVCSRTVYSFKSISSTIVLPDQPDYINHMLRSDRAVPSTSSPKDRKIELDL